MTEEDKSKDTDGKEQDVKELEQDSSKDKAPEKITLTQKELDGMLANARRKAEADYKALKSDFDVFKSTIEAKEQAANDAAAEKVEALRKDLPEPITKLLDNLSPVQQLEWLSDPNNVITKKEIPPLPNGRENGVPQRKIQTIV